MNSKYNRVLPRDLFNEAKLLKCIGHLIIMIQENREPASCKMSYSDLLIPDRFDVALLPEGSLVIQNLGIAVNRKPYIFKTTYNSKANFPLFVQHKDADYRVFDEEGKWDSEFHEFLNLIK